MREESGGVADASDDICHMICVLAPAFKTRMHKLAKDYVRTRTTNACARRRIRRAASREGTLRAGENTLVGRWR